MSRTFKDRSDRDTMPVQRRALLIPRYEFPDWDQVEDEKLEQAMRKAGLFAVTSPEGE